jgi:signal peptidase
MSTIVATRRAPEAGDPRVASFVPDVLGGTGTPVPSADVAPVRFQVRTVGSDERLVLSDDPAVRPPVPYGRIMVNAAATFVLLLVVGLTVLAVAPSLFGHDPIVVTSGSMRPTIDVGDVVVTTPSDGLALSERTVINYEVDDGLQLHRIVDVMRDGYRTAGDANADRDSGVVRPPQVRGTGTVVVPFIGLPRLWLDRGEWPWLAISTVVVAGALHVARSRWVEPDPQPWL